MLRSKVWLAGVGCLLVLAGGGLAYLIQTAGGVEVEDVRIPLEADKRLSALLYKPPNAVPENPAPGVLAVHGYINSRETQSPFAIELARRGYVVLAIDQTGHGFSEGAAFSAGFGGPAALRYLRSLPFVDAGNVGLTGHSMGGWTALAAAADQPDGYRALVLVGSSTGAPFAPAGSPAFPRNLAVIFSRYDEFAELMWGVENAADVVRSDKLQAVFGTEGAVEPGRLYGSIEAGDARWLAMPSTTHPGDHLSHDAVADTVTWMQRTLMGGQPLPVDDQIWLYKEIGTLIALIGGVCLLLGTFDLILRRFSPLEQPAPAAVAAPARGWWAGLLVTAAVPALTFYPLTGLGAAFAPNAIFPQAVTNQILVWALGNGAFALLMGMLLPARRSPLNAVPRPADAPPLAGVAVAALASVAVLYLAVLLSSWLFHTDMRFWVVALKPMAPHHLPAFLAYLIPFTAFFWVIQQQWHRHMSLHKPAGVQYAAAILGTVGGLALMLVAVYVYLLVAGHLPGVDPLFTIVAIQFVPVLAFTAIVSVFAWRRTGGAAAGAVMSGLVVTWYIIAGQATHL
ncbi:MAG: alpha/beta fold hydrolase [Gammaproteobacteria bacterium]|nr:alpha/beta fold hydrolase [Gammaproteobacteria bacterium]